MHIHTLINKKIGNYIDAKYSGEQILFRRPKNKKNLNKLKTQLKFKFCMKLTLFVYLSKFHRIYILGLNSYINYNYNVILQSLKNDTLRSYHIE